FATRDAYSTDSPIFGRGFAFTSFGVDLVGGRWLFNFSSCALMPFNWRQDCLFPSINTIRNDRKARHAPAAINVVHCPKVPRNTITKPTMPSTSMRICQGLKPFNNYMPR